jgi:hypothetical protein
MSSNLSEWHGFGKSEKTTKELQFNCLPNNRSVTSVLGLQNSVSSFFFFLHNLCSFLFLFFFSHTCFLLLLIPLVTSFLGYAEDSERPDGC